MNESDSALEIIHQYRLLRAKAVELDIALDAGERTRLLGLSAWLRRHGRLDPRRIFARHALVVPAQLTVPGGFGDGMLLNISGGGLCLSTYRPPRPGTTSIIRIADPAAGVEYVFPALVVWRTTTGRRLVGLAFDGVPAKTPFLIPPRGAWQIGLRFAASDQRPKVA